MMNSNLGNMKLSPGTVHKLPADMKMELASSKKLSELWESFTPLARNEWICWVEYAKQDGTRARHVKVMRSKMLAGERRPCCWIGCIHRTDKKISPSVQWVLDKRAKKSK